MSKRILPNSQWEGYSKNKLPIYFFQGNCTAMGKNQAAVEHGKHTRAYAIKWCMIPIQQMAPTQFLRKEIVSLKRRYGENMGNMETSALRGTVKFCQNETRLFGVRELGSHIWRFVVGWQRKTIFQHLVRSTFSNHLYSPDLATRDFHLFSVWWGLWITLKAMLKSKTFPVVHRAAIFFPKPCQNGRRLFEVSGYNGKHLLIQESDFMLFLK